MLKISKYSHLREFKKYNIDMFQYFYISFIIMKNAKIS